MMNPRAYHFGFNNPLLTIAEQLAVLAIGFLMEGDDSITVTVEKLCHYTRLSERALMHALDEMKRLKVVEYTLVGDDIEARVVGHLQGGAA